MDKFKPWAVGAALAITAARGNAGVFQRVASQRVIFAAQDDARHVERDEGNVGDDGKRHDDGRRYTKTDGPDAQAHGRDDEGVAHGTQEKVAAIARRGFLAGPNRSRACKPLN